MGGLSTRGPALEKVDSARCRVPLGFGSSALLGPGRSRGKEGGKTLPGQPALDNDLVLALNQAARIVPGRYVAEPNVAREAAE